MSLVDPASFPAWVQRLIIPALIGIIATLMGTIWAMQAGQMGDLKLTIQQEVADLKSDIRNLQTKNDEQLKAMGAQDKSLGTLTERIQNLVNSVNAMGSPKK
jgi:hypothetical protein